MKRLALVMVLTAQLMGCSTALAPRCAAGLEARVIDTLYFGTGMPAGGRVSPTDWQRFIDEEVTPRFPDGLTAWPASGQWRGGDGRIAQEPSYVLTLVHGGDARADAAVAALSARYKALFRQEAVLRVRSSGCVGF